MRNIVLFLALIGLISCGLPDVFQKFAVPFPESGVNKCKAENPGFNDSDCNVQDCLSSRFTLMGMKQLLEDMNEIFQDMNIAYWLDGASLFGALRFQAFLPWDDDVDVEVLADVFEPRLAEFRAKLTEKGYALIPQYGHLFVGFEGLFGGKAAFWQVVFTKESYSALLLSDNPNLTPTDLHRYYGQYLIRDHLPHFDVFPQDERDGSLFMRVAEFGPSSGGGVPKNSILAANNQTTNRRNILDKPYPVPMNIDKFLASWYSFNPVKDVVIQDPHKTRHICNKGIRFRDISNDPIVLNYFCEYLEYVFGDEFKGFSSELGYQCSKFRP